MFQAPHPPPTHQAVLRVSGPGFVLVTPAPRSGGAPTVPQQPTPSASNAASPDVVPSSVAPRSATRPSWILVVPVESGGNGVPIWGGASDWARGWVAPVRVHGMRIVAVRGDAEDVVRMPARALADPEGAEAGEGAAAMASKFGAPAVGELMWDGKGVVKAWLWTRGTGVPAEAEVDATPANAKDAALQLLDRLATGAGAVAGAHGGGSAPTANDVAQVDVEEHPEYAADGRFGFAVVLASEDPGEIDRVRRAVAGLPGVAVASSLADEAGAVVTGSVPGDRAALLAALAAAGVSVARD